MEKEEAGKYKVIITASAETYFYKVVEYLYDYMSLERAEKIATDLHDMALSLGLQYRRGTVEKKLAHRKKSYRYILFKRTPRAQIKIVYYIDEEVETIYITDFFPTEKNPKRLLRNK